MLAMDYAHPLHHSKQQATQSLALVGVLLVLFGIYVAFAFAASYYEKSVSLVSQIPLKQQTLSQQAKAAVRTPPSRNPSPTAAAAIAAAQDAQYQLELKQYNLNGQISILVFSFAMYKLALLIACSLMLIGGLAIWKSYHSWWTFTKSVGSSATNRVVAKRPVAVVRRKA